MHTFVLNRLKVVMVPAFARFDLTKRLRRLVIAAPKRNNVFMIELLVAGTKTENDVVS